ncbi:ribosome-associated translation inhibitor RaiA [Lipingzhangella sp. LS1_29]|uniref:Ribosome hibernation promoting factor n=1 Tax=Lipingzhangella rawalii TaxID=2055835 RepID=A0ABU2H5X7_9ACTN|nr:ribosome-associated translation inhibitor RaiA [Lipingzhangella rawalii]MDS1270422.1 ribosome-associated translation inhibitor RaiA [Lipingzhangella rawalii]
MDIIVKGRRTGVSDKFRKHVETKLGKLSKWEQKGMSVDVEVSKERNPKLASQRERVELTIHSSGPTIRGEAAADDRYGAFDLALDRIEARLRKAADRRKIHRGNRAPVSVAAATAELGGPASAGATLAPPIQRGGTPESDTASVSQPATSGNGAGRGTAAGADRATNEGAEESDDRVHEDIVELETQGDGPVVVREKLHRAKPMTIDQALFEMELVGHDFYLFRDEERDTPSVVYRRKGFNYGVIRLLE